MARSSLPSYERIRVTGLRDAEDLYPILARYVADPSLADSVTEVVLAAPSDQMSYVIDSRSCHDPGLGGDCCWAIRSNRPIPEAIEDEQVHQAVEKYITQLGLSHKATNIMLDSWEWETRRRNGTSQHQKQWDGDEELQDPGIAYFNTAAVLLLSLCKNISTLYFGQKHTSAVTDYLLQVNYGTLPHAALSNLRHVELGSVEWVDHDERIYKDVEFMQHMRYFHRLPSIQTISMDGAGDFEIESAFHVKRIGAMKKLHITRSDISDIFICQMLQFPKALEEFTLSTGGLMHQDGGMCNTNSEDIGKALRQHRHSLKILTLSFDHFSLPNSHTTSDPLENYSEEYDFLKGGYTYRIGDSPQEALREGKEAYGHDYLAMDLDIQDAAVDDGMAIAHHTIGSLRDFTALTNLSVSLGALLGFHLTHGNRYGQGPPPSSTVRLVDVLPPNLEYLRVYDYHRGEVEYFDEQIDDFMRQRAKFPKLTEITGINAVIKEIKRYSHDEEAYELPERDFSWKVVA